jgi:hypothetical protein
MPHPSYCPALGSGTLKARQPGPRVDQTCSSVYPGAGAYWMFCCSQYVEFALAAREELDVASSFQSVSNERQQRQRPFYDRGKRQS